MATRARATAADWELIRESVLGPLLGRMTGASDAILDQLFSPARDGGEWAAEAALAIERLNQHGLLGHWALGDAGQGTIVDRLSEMARAYRT